MKYAVPFTYHDLLGACDLPGCPICNLSQKLITRYLKTLFYESGNDPEIRDRIRQRKGFCHEHTWLVVDARLGNALAIAIVSRDLIQNDLEHLPEITAKSGLFSKIKGRISAAQNNPETTNWLYAEKTCLACEQQASVEKRIIKTFIESLNKPEFLGALDHAGVICRPHLSQLLESGIQPDAAGELISLTVRKWQELESELTEFIRKNDYRYSKEKMGKERDSWKRAAGALVGNKPDSNLQI